MADVTAGAARYASVAEVRADVERAGGDASALCGFGRCLCFKTALGISGGKGHGCDCGLFTCMAADYIANNQLDLAYDQGAMPAFRRRMAARIIAGTLDAEEARQPGAPLRSECL